MTHQNSKKGTPMKDIERDIKQELVRFTEIYVGQGRIVLNAYGKKQLALAKSRLDKLYLERYLGMLPDMKITMLKSGIGRHLNTGFNQCIAEIHNRFEEGV